MSVSTYLWPYNVTAENEKEIDKQELWGKTAGVWWRWKKRVKSRSVYWESEKWINEDGETGWIQTEGEKLKVKWVAQGMRSRGWERNGENTEWGEERRGWWLMKGRGVREFSKEVYLRVSVIMCRHIRVSETRRTTSMRTHTLPHLSRISALSQFLLPYLPPFPFLPFI